MAKLINQSKETKWTLESQISYKRDKMIEQVVLIAGQKVKVGDYVNLTFDHGAVCVVPVLGIKDKDMYYDSGCTSLISECAGNSGSWVVTGKWQPQPGDWVLCWHPDSPNLVYLRQVKTYPSELKDYPLRDTIDNYWKCFCPFNSPLHNLPLHLRNIK